MSNKKPKKLMEDPLQMVRKVRHEISARFDHDPRKVIEYYMQVQERFKERLLPAKKSIKKAVIQKGKSAL